MGDLVVSISDYSARYGEPDDPEQVAVLLGDAANMALAVYESRLGQVYRYGDHPSFDRAVAGVCAAMVQRAVNVPDGMYGATQLSQGAGGYSASVSYSSALGDLYIGKSDLKRLGLTGMCVSSIKPQVRDD